MSTAKKNIALQNALLPGAKSLVDQCPPDDPDTDVNRGCLLYKEARYEEGLAKFNAAQQVVGYDPHLSYNVALCYYRQVLLVRHKNKWHDLRRKLVTSLSLFFEGGKENILIGPKNIFD